MDLTPGSVLHIQGFSTRGHPAKNKYLLIIGQKSDSEALAFMISSQLKYLKIEPHKHEVIKVPYNATTFLNCESIIQCFSVEELNITDLIQGSESGKVKRVGKLQPKYLHKIREVVGNSQLLSTYEIEAIIKVLPKRTGSA